MNSPPETALDGPRLTPLAGGKASALVVLLHGYGSNGDEMLHFGRAMQAALPTAAFVAPHGPQRRVPTADGRMWWALESFDDAALAAGATAAAPDLDAFLDLELARHDVAGERLLLAGFSQGMMMALHVGLRRAEPPAGIAGLSGMLVAASRLTAEIRNRAPVLLLHGTADDVVPFHQQQLATQALKAVGVPVEAYASPGVAHCTAPDWPAKVAAFATQVFTA